MGTISVIAASVLPKLLFTLAGLFVVRLAFNALCNIPILGIGIKFLFGWFYKIINTLIIICLILIGICVVMMLLARIRVSRERNKERIRNRETGRRDWGEQNENDSYHMDNFD